MDYKHISLNDIYNITKEMFHFAKRFGDISGKSTHYCKDCGTELRIAYLENTIYMVVCPCCEVIHLVKASCPEKALNKIGNKVLSIRTNQTVFSSFGKEETNVKRD